MKLLLIVWYDINNLCIALSLHTSRNHLSQGGSPSMMAIKVPAETGDIGTISSTNRRTKKDFKWTIVCYNVGGSRTRHTCTGYFKQLISVRDKYRNSSPLLNGGDAPTATNAIVGPTNTYLLSSLNIDTFRLLRYVTSIHTY